jgi:hypothetical protein
MLLLINSYKRQDAKKIFFGILFLIPLFFSCAGQTNTVFVPVPDAEYHNKKTQERININNITETKDGSYLPVWLRTFINGGIAEVEKIDSYRGKYVFIAINEGVNFSTLNIWANYFSRTKDFSIFAAGRIEKRMLLSASLYPDDEYGSFFEIMVKKAYNAEYSGVLKEDTYWIKLLNNDISNNDGIVNADTEIYNFFVLLTIDKVIMESVISGMMTEAMTGVSPTEAQRVSINRLRQIFFQGF